MNRKEELLLNKETLDQQIKDFEKGIQFLSDESVFKSSDPSFAVFRFNTVKRLNERLRRIYVLRMENEAELNGQTPKEYMEEAYRKAVEETTKEFGPAPFVKTHPSGTVEISNGKQSIFTNESGYRVFEDTLKEEATKIIGIDGKPIT